MSLQERLTVKVYPVLNADTDEFMIFSRSMSKSIDHFSGCHKELVCDRLPRNQAVFAEMFNQLDQQPRNKIDRVQKIYMLENIDANLAHPQYGPLHGAESSQIFITTRTITRW